MRLDAKSAARAPRARREAATAPTPVHLCGEDAGAGGGARCAAGQLRAEDSHPCFVPFFACDLYDIDDSITYIW